MNRIATTLTTLAASFLISQGLGAADPTIQALESRLQALESRLGSVEAALASESGYTYKNAATLEATKGGASAAPIPAPPIPETAPSAPAGPATTYVIQDGDTLGKIAAKFNIERKTLLEANRLGEGQPIYIGETLMIPGSPASAPAAPPVVEANQPAPAKQEAVVIGETKKPGPAATTVHTVAKGDTLTSLAKKYGTSIESLKSANGLRGDTISLGQSLKIPTTEAPVAQAPAPAKPEPTTKPEQANSFQYDNPLLKSDETYGYYNVAKGDNLYALARDFFTTMAELQRINNLGSSTVIYPGNELIVPTSKYNSYHNKNGGVAKR